MAGLLAFFWHILMKYFDIIMSQLWWWNFSKMLTFRLDRSSCKTFWWYHIFVYLAYFENCFGQHLLTQGFIFLPNNNNAPHGIQTQDSKLPCHSPGQAAIKMSSILVCTELIGLIIKHRHLDSPLWSNFQSTLKWMYFRTSNVGKIN